MSERSEQTIEQSAEAHGVEPAEKDAVSGAPEEPEDAAAPVDRDGATDAENDAEDESDDEDEEDEGDEGDEGGTVVTETRRALLPALGAVVGLTVLICLVLVSFGLPALKGGPHRVPIGLAGPADLTARVKVLFSQSGNDTFRVREYTSETGLRSAISDRKVYGGLVLGNTSATMLVASGGSPTVAQVLNSVAGELSSSVQIPVKDVVPLPKQDPRGTGLAAVGLPIVLAGVLPGGLLLFRRFSRQLSIALGVVAVFSLVSGFAIGAILQFWFHSVTGNYALTAIGLALGVAAVAFPLTGLATIAGRIGVGIGTALMVLVGHPLSGLSTAPEWYPGFWGDLGQALPPGATGTLLRSTAFFSGRGSMSAVLVLAAWTIGGLLLVVVGTLLNPQDPFLDDGDSYPDDVDLDQAVPVASTL